MSENEISEAQLQLLEDCDTRVMGSGSFVWVRDAAAEIRQLHIDLQAAREKLLEAANLIEMGAAGVASAAPFRRAALDSARRTEPPVKEQRCGGDGLIYTGETGSDKRCPGCPDCRGARRFKASDPTRQLGESNATPLEEPRAEGVEGPIKLPVTARLVDDMAHRHRGWWTVVDANGRSHGAELIQAEAEMIAAALNRSAEGSTEFQIEHARSQSLLLEKEACAAEIARLREQLAGKRKREEDLLNMLQAMELERDEDRAERDRAELMVAKLTGQASAKRMEDVK